jgi:hypothetical protein
MRAAAVLAISAAIFAAQTPARDAAVVPTGTASITGTVVSDGADARPVRIATVSLIGPGTRGRLIASSDENGQFAFRNLPPGRFSISVERPG